MIHSYRCKNETRRALVRNTKGADGKPILNGIDFLEVATVDQKTLRIQFIHPLPGQSNQVPPSPAPPLKAANIVIEGGVRITGIRAATVAAVDRTLTVTVADPGDFSVYVFRLVASADDPAPPAGFDPQLSAVEFSFKVTCPSDFDCRPAEACEPAAAAGPDINYLAKDYASFRRVMLDRLSLLVPAWTERNPADLGMALVELLAYVGDHLSYRQDAVATEAYLGTARRRSSVRRHARLVDYAMFEGSNARVWVQIQLKPGRDNVLLKRSGGQSPTMLLTRVEDIDAVIAPGSAAQRAAMAADPMVFELMDDVRVFQRHAELPFYTWGDRECCLPRGATRATLKGNYPNLKRGAVLIIQEKKGPKTGLESDADPSRRHAVRLIADAVNTKDPLTQEPIAEIEWHNEDALPFPCCLSSKSDKEHGEDDVDDVSIVLGNIVLADHGQTVAEEDLGVVPAVRLLRMPALRAGSLADGLEMDLEGGAQAPRQPIPPRFRPTLKGRPLTQAALYPYRDDEVVPQSARAAMQYRNADISPQVISIRSTDAAGSIDWSVKGNLLSSEGRPDCVVEMEEDGTAGIRFGDGRFGSRPVPGSRFSARYRIGNGVQGNIGADTLAHIVTDNPDVAGVVNPMAAQGGREPESLVSVRQNAPYAFRTQERAVTMEDYADITERHVKVQQAAASLRWTGSWRTVFVTVDRAGGGPIDPKFETDLRRHLDRYRMAGHDVEIDDPRFVPLEIEMQICVHPDYFRSDVMDELLRRFSSRVFPDGRRGLFHPDNFTFGQSVYVSPLYAAAEQVAGVASARVTVFQRQGRPDTEAVETGELKLDRLEIARLDNDANFPERGVFRLMVEGGK
jgi:baseplate J-like protein